ncbi:MAG: ECF transporter S component [Acidobacteriia bacterium]|nr:ECF transporter S component [Terriglobia bacterium]
MQSRTKLLTLIAALSAANAAFRIVLAGGPYNVKPTAFLTIIAGIVAGPIPGLIVGWLSMTISDLALGAGYWTIETSAGMAVVGLLAGLLWHRSSSLGRIRMTIGGYLLTMLYDLFTAVVDALIYSYPWQASVAGLYVPFLTGSPTPYPFGFAHEITTAVLCLAIGPALVSRIRKVYHHTA